MTLLQADIKQAHLETELIRLYTGWPGFGCSDCEVLYKTLDLVKWSGYSVMEL